MREHLFKARRADAPLQCKAWAYGYLSGEKEITGYDEQDIGDFVLKQRAEALVFPETICEYTGLTDKNGKKIFEGDIVKDIDERIYQIKCFEYEWIAEQTRSFYINIKHLKPCEVIGNIHDNPELLK